MTEVGHSVSNGGWALGDLKSNSDIDPLHIRQHGSGRRPYVHSAPDKTRKASWNRSPNSHSRQGEIRANAHYYSGPIYRARSQKCHRLQNVIDALTALKVPPITLWNMMKRLPRIELTYRTKSRWHLVFSRMIKNRVRVAHIRFSIVVLFLQGCFRFCAMLKTK